jgi:hypothetical protein
MSDKGNDKNQQRNSQNLSEQKIKSKSEERKEKIYSSYAKAVKQNGNALNKLSKN